MSGKVELQIVDGPMRGKTFSFEEHDTFLFGRMNDCHACLPHDPMVSRHHFIMEVNPPDARIRDLGSLNGTYINDIKHGSREAHETPQEGARRQYPEVDLKNGDQIKVGETVLTVCIQVPAVCCECSGVIAEEDRDSFAWIGGTFVCNPCKNRLMASADTPRAPEPVRCQKCNKDVSQELGDDRRGKYICESCRRKDEADPARIIIELLRKAGKQHDAEKTPDIEGYQIENKLGAGGFGAVYLARRKEDGQHVAIKLMLSKVAVDARARDLFLREIAEMKKLHHDNIVPFIESGSTGSVFYIIMDYCEGGGLNNLMMRKGGKLSLSEAEPIMLQALEGLAYVHQQDIVHRDLKPANILLAGSENQWDAKIADLGLAKNFEKAGLSGMTVTGGYAGTPHFMPREQLVNFKYVKPVSDVWSLSATFYNMLTGRFPKEFTREKDPMNVVLHGKIIPIRERQSSIPKKMARVIDRALDDQIENRYQTAGDFKQALENAL